MMETMERDPLYISQQVKFVRKWMTLTQENLADAASLTTRTIEKVESGRHRPDEQTLRSIARAVNIDVSFFEKPSPEQEAHRQAVFERAFRTTLLVPVHPIHTTNDFIAEFAGREALRTDISAVTDEAALDAAAEMADLISDIGELWSDIGTTARLDLAREFLRLVGTIEAHGFVCFLGQHQQQLPYKNRPPLVFSVTLMTVRPKEDAEGTRYAMVHLDDGWENMPSDRAGSSL